MPGLLAGRQIGCTSGAVLAGHFLRFRSVYRPGNPSDRAATSLAAHARLERGKTYVLVEGIGFRERVSLLEKQRRRSLRCSEFAAGRDARCCDTAVEECAA